jgi:hypothetical protein
MSENDTSELSPSKPPKPDETDLPSAQQKRTELQDEQTRDSDPLPGGHEALLNDGILDLASRRSHRPGIVIAALVALGFFLVNVTIIIVTLACGFTQALKPEVVARSAAVQLAEKVGAAASTSATAAPTVSQVSGSAPEKGKSASGAARTQSESADANQPRVVRVEAKIFGEIKDSMVPLVALVSILTIAIVVILATMLKAAFAVHPHAAPTSANDKEKQESDAFVPALEACKSFVETLKGAFGKG